MNLVEQQAQWMGSEDVGTAHPGAEAPLAGGVATAQPPSPRETVHRLRVLHTSIAQADAVGVGGSGVAGPVFHPGGGLVRRPLARWRPRRQYLLEGAGWRSLRLASDLLTALTAVIIANLLASPAETSISTLFAFPLLVVGAFAMRSLYARRMREVVLDLIGPLAGGISMAAMTLLAVQLLVFNETAAAPTIGRVWGIAIPLIVAGRAVLAHVQHLSRARLRVGKATLIVGAGQVGAQVAQRLSSHPEYGLRPVGFIDADPLAAPDGREDLVPVLGGPESLRRIIEDTGAEHIILAFSQASDRGLLPLVRLCDELRVEVSLVPRLFEAVNDRVGLERLGGLPLLGLRAIDPKGWQFKVKYALDRPIALLLILAMSPLLLAAALAVRLSSPGPIFFRQRRVGQDGKAFDLLKFRSMRMRPDEQDDSFRPEDGTAPGGIEGHDRRTPVGRFLRRSAMDELPQLFNVLRGEMSLVGPRPERPEFVELFQVDHDRYSDRHRVKSGITGWAQVHGLRGQTSLADRIEWDNFYIENWSLWLDLKATLMTFGAVCRSGEDT
jgi:exopolysaccharide biosynthesis polyprenyl glycosylphosphotransferase